MEASEFEWVCAGCLATRRVLDSPEPLESCPVCGLVDAWTGPIARERFSRPYSEALFESPFYVVARRTAARRKAQRPRQGWGRA